MKQYIVFWGDSYYPKGGFADTHKYFDLVESALAYADGIVEADSLMWSQGCGPAH